jgi:H+/Cl- antiporter ClcA
VTSAAAPDPVAILRSRRFIGLLIFASIVGIPVSALAYWFLKLVDVTQNWVFKDLPVEVGFQAQPTWWPVIPLGVAGLLVGAVIRYLPGTGGHSPADGFKAGGVPLSADLPGIALAAFFSLTLGAVIGPEAPLIALGGGLAVWSVRLAKRDVPQQMAAVLAAVGSFAAISTLLGSPLAGAFLLMEASGLGGPTATLVLVPGLLGAGIGSLIFIGLASLTGYGTFSLAVPNLPAFPRPDVAEFGWALVAGVAAALVCFVIRRLALLVRPHIERRLLVLTPIAGLAIAGLAIAFAEATGKSTSEVLFSGQNQLGPFLQNAGTYSAGALLLLVACKGLGYSIALAGFRGGPVFPAIFLGAAGGVALSHLPGLPLVPGVAVGIGAMSAGMLKLPLTSVLLAVLILGGDGITTMPLTIVAVVVSYVLTIRLEPSPTDPPNEPIRNGEAPATQPKLA